jgi:hypothetical protein
MDPDSHRELLYIAIDRRGSDNIQIQASLGHIIPNARALNESFESVC